MTETTAWQGELALTGVGMLTPVGMNAPTSAAALRAGVSRIGELSCGLTVAADGGEESVVCGGEIARLGEHHQGGRRLALLAMAAADEALADAGLDAASLSGIRIALPAMPWAGRQLDHRPAIEAALVDRYAVETHVVDAGRSAALVALREAASGLAAEERGVLVVVAADSWIDRLAVSWLRDEGRLIGGSRAAGVVPGEAGAALVVETLSAARARGARVHARVRALAGSIEQTPPGEPSRATALTGALAAVTAAQAVPTPLVVSDMNGERSRAFEWMFAFCRGVVPHARDFRHWFPAESIGDTGAASGAISLGWAAIALSRGYASEGEALIWGASDEGAREAALLAAEVG